jgi:hypothetical protein
VELKYATEKSLDLDMFFQTFFRAKFADSENDYERFEGDYHYEMYRNPRVRKYFEDYRNKELPDEGGLTTSPSRATRAPTLI